MDLFKLLSTQPAHLLWLMSGLVLLGMGMLVADPAVSALGFAAFITAIVALSVPSVSIQLLLWVILSVSLAVVLRGMVPKESKDLQPSSEAEVTETIYRGGTGTVSYEGSYWTARCQISDITIPVGQVVLVVGRQGNTLIVLPSQFPGMSDS